MRNKIIGKDSFNKDDITIGEEYDIDMIQTETVLNKTFQFIIKGAIRVTKFEDDIIEKCQCCNQELPDDLKQRRNQSKIEGVITSISSPNHLMVNDTIILYFNKSVPPQESLI